MERILITRPVSVKVKVTENYKLFAAKQLEQSIRSLDAELQRLETVLSELPSSDNARQKKLQETYNYHKQQRQKLVQQAKSISELPLGSELVHGRVESLVEVGIGDDWGRIMGVEIVVEDGTIVEIREGVSGGG
ncbi:MAG: YlqD family protein [Peptococcaceae bacterium]|nr:YlqD family protein [Peptococcaceae bacterium]